MIMHKYRNAAEEGQPFYRLLCSDYHIGSANSNHDLIVKDLATIKLFGGKALVNGDVFDAICPTDKRYDAGVLHPSLRGKKDLAAAIVDLAFNLLRPYADVIDVMGIGNHEEAWIKYNHGDPVRQLIERLNNEAGADITHGGFWGYMNTTFDLKGVKFKPKHRLLYLHGTGGDSPVTKGTIDFNRKGRNWKYDLLTFGHKRNHVDVVEAIADVSEDDIYFERRQLQIQTASYYRNYRELKKGEELDQSYAASKGHPPKPMGGTFVTLRPQRNELGIWEVRQDHSSDLIPQWAPKRLAAS
jgi:hypothetical protein